MAGVKPNEDPMDLGPFLQNYVLKNPFHDMFMGAAGGGGVTKPPPVDSTPKPVVIGQLCKMESLTSADTPVVQRKAKLGRKSTYAAAIESIKQKTARDLMNDIYGDRTPLAAIDTVEGKSRPLSKMLPLATDCHEDGNVLAVMEASTVMNNGEMAKVGGHVGSNKAFAGRLKRSVGEASSMVVVDPAAPENAKLQSW